MVNKAVLVVFCIFTYSSNLDKIINKASLFNSNYNKKQLKVNHKFSRLKAFFGVFTPSVNGKDTNMLNVLNMNKSG